MAAINLRRNLGELRSYCNFLLDQLDITSQDDPFPPEALDAYILAEHDLIVGEIKRGYEDFFVKLVKADIVAGKKSYALPTDHHRTIRLEYMTDAAFEEFLEIIPLKSISERDRFQFQEGVGLNEAASSFFLRRGITINYHFKGTSLMLVPHFKDSRIGGMRLWYQYHPAAPVVGSEDTWVPFGGKLPNHHEILSVGAVNRAQMAQGEPPFFTDLYNHLYKILLDDVEKRQVQRPKYVVERDEY